MLLNKIREIITTEFEYAAGNELTLDTEFLQLGFSSINLMALILRFEEEFNIIIDDDVIINLKCIRDIYVYLCEKGINSETEIN